MILVKYDVALIIDANPDRNPFWGFQGISHGVGSMAIGGAVEIWQREWLCRGFSTKVLSHKTEFN
jgi:hypothetical protein